MTELHDDRCATRRGHPCNCAAAAFERRPDMPHRGPYENMRNRSMARKLMLGACIDISKLPVVPGGYVDLGDVFKEGVDYCNATDERWIWCIARRRSDGKVLASYSTDLYQNDAFECLWLR